MGTLHQIKYWEWFTLVTVAWRLQGQDFITRDWSCRVHKSENMMAFLLVIPWVVYCLLSVFFPLPGSECDEEDVDFEQSDSDESWTTESAISSESILSSMCMNGGDEKPFACPVPGCKKRYKVGCTSASSTCERCEILLPLPWRLTLHKVYEYLMFICSKKS